MTAHWIFRQPVRVAFREPLGGGRRITAFHDLEKLPVAGIDELGRPALPTPRALAHEQRLVERQRAYDTNAILIRVEQRVAVGDDRVVHRVPITTQRRRDLRH